MRDIIRNILLFLCWVPIALQAQQLNYYSCDFENEQVNQQWRLNNGSLGNTVANKWYIGSATNNGGLKSMYISANGGDSAYYVAASGCVVSFVELDMAAGDYILSFDWRARGNVKASDVGLYVCWVPETENDTVGDGNPIQVPVSINTGQTSALPYYAKTYSMQVDGLYKKNLNNYSTWRSSHVKVSSDGTKKYRLAFMWCSTMSSAINPGACVDNILIMREGECDAPKNLRYKEAGEDILLEWDGDEDAQYNLKIFNYLEEIWAEEIVSGTSYLVKDADEGYNTFYVRRICGVDNLGETIYSYPLMTTESFYLPSRHCGLDYLTLTEDNCYVATSEDFQGGGTRNVLFHKGLVDNGPGDGLSRHTVHSDPYEIDPVTVGPDGVGLKTVPEREVASVRLGNWANGTEAERVEFMFHVDTMTNPLLLMKYAVVIEYLKDHSEDVNARFELRVLDSKRRPLKVAKCAAADFTYNNVIANGSWEDEGWHHLKTAGTMVLTPSGGERTSVDVLWKEWTLVGVDLSDYHDEDVIVQLSTYDCSQGGHFGYAYFVLKCSKGDLEGMTCGEVNTKFKTPSGFEYRWYKKEDYARVHNDTLPWDESLIISREREFEITDRQDTTKYAVDCMFVGDSSCYFTQYVSSLARFPKAAGNWQLQRQECQNKVNFTGDFYMVEENHVSHQVNRTDEKCDMVKWVFGDGTYSYDYNPEEHVYPAEGGEYEVTMHAYYETCEDETTMKLNIPPIGTIYDSISGKGCSGTNYRVRYKDYTGSEQVDKSYYESGVYNDTVMSSIGCDSVMVLSLEMVDQIETTIDTTIMNDQTYKYDSGTGIKTINTTGTYTGYLLTVAGCDSIVTHNVYVHERLQVSMPPMIDICANDGYVEIPFIFNSGRTDVYSLRDSAGAIFDMEKYNMPDMALTEKEGIIELEMPDVVPVNYYPLVFTFYDSISGNVMVPVRLAVHYSDSILVQKWNDVIALRDSTRNGGYDFVGFQWYKNGEKIEGATKPYLYVGGGTLEMEETSYYAELVRNDGLVMTTCPIYPTQHTDISVFPSIVAASQRIAMRLKSAARVVIYDSMGRLYSECELSEGYQELVTPQHSGIYIVHVIGTDSQDLKHKIIVL